LQDTEDDLWTIAQAARNVGVTEAVIRRLEKRGELTPHVIEWQGKQRRPLFWRRDVLAARPPHQQKSQ